MNPTSKSLFLVPCLVLAAGCAPGKGDVSGTVKVKGTLLSYGRIVFQSEVGRGEVASSPIVDGKYSLSGITEGPVKVAVESLRIPMDPEKMKELAPKGLGIIPKNLSKLPSGKGGQASSRYGNVETSGLSFAVQAGQQTKDFDLPD